MGIAIPLIGIFVTIAVSRSDSDSDSKAPSANSAPAPGAQNPQASQGSQKPPATGGGGQSASNAPSPGGQTPRVLFGPGSVTVDPNKQYVEFDTNPPLVSQSNKAADLMFAYTLGAPELITVGSTNTLAAIPQGNPDPTPEVCAEAVRKRGTYLGGELTPGTRLCMVTNEGRTGYFRVVWPAAAGVPLRLEATVWDLTG
ncbi:hypothetical protein [Embleya scabrispora]|uniref:hypothetical protein n=1 Tax=Embleya scabrispora TaxID=159449 RepID=UPI00037EB77B|nr:hypothetical protein [Embleya scabrispora]MYS87841.1 hypothetical protein [Streptomyces sp. SID5474]